MKPGSFFWVLDPVMGDNGKLYVAEDVVPAYASLVQHADLILPNQYEAECVRLFRLPGVARMLTGVTQMAIRSQDYRHANPGGGDRSPSHKTPSSTYSHYFN